MSLTVIRVGECKRCGRCCDKRLAQPEKWASLEKTDMDWVRKSPKDGRSYPAVCKRLNTTERTILDDYHYVQAEGAEPQLIYRQQTFS